jgi:hypothetical protein
MIEDDVNPEPFLERGEVPVLATTVLTGVATSIILTPAIGLYAAFAASAVVAFGGNHLARRVFKYGKQHPRKPTLG